MPGYIQRLLRLAPEDQEVEIEEQIERTYTNIVQGSVFRSVMVTTNAWKWVIDQCNILAMHLEHGQVRIKLAYLATGENEDPADRSMGDTIRGQAEAVINDDGEVRYEAVTGELVMDADVAEGHIDRLHTRQSRPATFVDRVIA